MIGPISYFRNLIHRNRAPSPAEQWLLRALLDSLPPHIKWIAEAQIATYDRAHREVDGREVNFYSTAGASKNAPNLAMRSPEATLVGITASVSGGPARIYARLTAVNGRVFCMSFNQRVAHLDPSSMQLTSVKESWRSNFPLHVSEVTSIDVLERVSQAVISPPGKP